MQTSTLSIGFRTLLLAIAGGGTLAAQMTGASAADRIARENRVREESLVASGVDTGSGAFVYESRLLTVHGQQDLPFDIAYNSLLNASFGDLGIGWGHPYEARLEAAGSNVTVYWDANRKNGFRQVGVSTAYESIEHSSRYDRLVRQGSAWRLTLRDVTDYRFNAEGRLTGIGNKIGQQLNVTYAGSRIDRVTEPISGQALRFFYRGGDCQVGSVPSSACPVLLHHIRDNSDRMVLFEHDAQGRLRHIRTPGKLDARTFPAVITGVLLNIPDNDPSGLRLNIPIAAPGNVGLLMFNSLTIQHPRPRDLEVFLTSPRGTQARFVTVKDTPDWSLAQWATSAFNGEPATGTWTIRIVDTRAGAAGTLNHYGLRITGQTYGTELTYSPGGGILSVIAPDGETILTNTYDASGRVSAQDDGRPGGLPWLFTYADRPGSAGVVTMFTDRAAAQQTFEHDGNYNLIRYRDALGSEDSYAYDGNGNRIRSQDALGRVTQFGYDAAGNLTSLTDAAGNTTNFSYDANANLTGVTDPLGQSTQYEYTSSNNMRRATDALGHQDTKTYGGQGELRGNLLQDGAGMTYAYANGRIAAATHPVNGVPSSGVEYDDVGRLILTSDADGFERHMEYDDRDLVIREVDELGEVTETTYDVRGRPIRVLNRSGQQTVTAYDGNDNVISVTNSLGEATAYAYDAEDRLIRQTDPLGNSVRFAYDQAGQVTQETDALGNVLRREYDKVGNEVALYDAKGVLMEATVYNERNLPVEITDALGSKVRMQYDAAERMVSITDAFGKVTQFEYDALDRETSTTDPLGRTVEQTFLSDDVVARLEDARGNSIGFQYDPANRLTRVSYPWGQTQITYTNRDQPRRIDYPGGRRVEYSYDDRGSIRTVAQTKSGETAYNDTYVYDESDRLTEIRRNSVRRLRYEYDALGRVIRYTGHNGEQVGYEWDSRGNLAAVVYPGGDKVTYEYNEAGNLATVTDWAGRITRYTYDANALVTGIVFPNGTRRDMSYDAAGELVRRVDLDSAGRPIVDYAYSYDAGGRLTLEANAAAQPPFTPQAANVSYRADRDWIETYNGQGVAYDSEGNLTQGPLGAQASATFRYSASGTLLNAGVYSYLYDSQDNLIGVTGPAASYALVVNPLPEMTQVLQARRTGGQSESTTRYVWGIGLIYAEDAAGVKVHHYDYRGNTVALTDSAGVVSGRVSYGPFGEIGTREGNTNTLFLHNGLFGVLTDDSGLEYMRYRWYSPQLKRFLSPDAVLGGIDDPGSMNLYAFAGNNPIGRVDPKGEFWNVIGGAIIGAVVGVVTQAVTDLVTGKKPQWQDYAAAAIGGAVGGAITGACLGVCGPAALVAAGAVAGAVDGSGSVIAGSLLRGEQVDAKEAVTAGLIGGLLGGATGGAGNKLGRRVPKGILKTAGKPVRRVPGRVRFNTDANTTRLIPRIGKVPTPARGGKAVRFSLSTREAASLNAINYPGGATRVRSFSGLAKSSPSAADQLLAGVRSKGRPALRSRSAVADSGRQAVNSGKKGVYGENRHARNWEDALKRAGRTFPNSPLQLGGTF